MVAPIGNAEAVRAAESEAALIGCLLFEPDVVWPEVKSIVSAPDLTRADHRIVFRAVAAIMESVGRCTGAAVIDHLNSNGEIEAAGGREYLAGLVADSPSTSGARGYATTVRQFSSARRVVDISEQIAARARLGDAADAIRHGAKALNELDLGSAAIPFDAPPAASWADAPTPQPRQWVLEGLIPAGRVTSLFGNGGLGKTLVAIQIGLHVSLGRPLFGIDVMGGPVLGVFCEDETDELNRRTRAACQAEGIDLASVDRFHAVSRDGDDSVLCTFEHDHIRLTGFYAQLEATVAEIRPTLLILDTAADLFAGDFVSTPHVRQFLKIALGGLCVRHGCAVLLLAHPSAAAMNSGDGGGFSTAWSNSVRSRLYLRRPPAPETAEGEEPQDTQDKRLLEVKKSNYAADGTLIPLEYVNGYFIRDSEPVSESRGPRANTSRVALAAVDMIRSHDPAVVSFKALFESMQMQGLIPAGPYDIRRKPLSRALRQLMADGVVRESTVPRGYRLGAAS